MEKKSFLRNEVMMSGIGGMGVLMAGKLLASAALEKYRHVSWLPSYGVEKRGGLCECTVIFSDKKISSPLIDQARTLVVFAASQFKAFEQRVRPGGIILVDSAGQECEQERTDYELLNVPGMEIAHSMGEPQVINLVLLGAYIGATNAIPVEIVEGELEKKLGADKTLRERNRTAFRQGVELGSRIGF